MTMSTNAIGHISRNRTSINFEFVDLNLELKAKVIFLRSSSIRVYYFIFSYSQSIVVQTPYLYMCIFTFVYLHVGCRNEFKMFEFCHAVPATEQNSLMIFFLHCVNYVLIRIEIRD